MGILIKGLKVA